MSQETVQTREEKVMADMIKSATIEARKKFAGSLINVFDIHIPSNQLEVVLRPAKSKKVFEFFVQYADRIVTLEGSAIVNFRNHTVKICVERINHFYGGPINYYRWDDYDMMIS